MSSSRLAGALGVAIALIAHGVAGCGAKPSGEQHSPISGMPSAGSGAPNGGAPNGGAPNGGPPTGPVGGTASAAGTGGSTGTPAGASGASGSTSTVGGSSAPTGGSGDALDEDGGVASDAGTQAPDAAVETCDKIPPSSMSCEQPLAPGDARKCSLQLGLDQRSYYLYAPKTYDPCKPTALIIDCHGAMETAEAQAGIVTLHTAQTTNGPLDYPGIGSGWRLEADTPEGGFIVVTPQGIDNVWTSLNNDPQFFLDIVTATKKIANIDNAKVYMTGISNGSLISYETACAHTDVFSGIAAFSAGQSCSSLGKPIPVISFDAEPDFAYSTTVSASDTMVSLDKCKGAVNPNWLTIDSSTTDTVCRNDPFDTHPTLVPCSSIKKTTITDSGIEPTVCKRWDDCNGGVAVVFCDVAPSTLHGSANAAVDAHILYGNATSLNMPSVAWRFFKSFWK